MTKEVYEVNGKSIFCGECKHYSNFHCKVHHLNIFPRNSFPCKDFIKKDDATFDEDIQTVHVFNIQDHSLHERDIKKQYGFKLPIETRIMIGLKKKGIPPWLIPAILGGIFAFLNYYFYTLYPTGRAYSLGIMFPNISLVFIPYLVFYKIPDILFDFYDALPSLIDKRSIIKDIKPLLNSAFSKWRFFFPLGVMIIFTGWIISPGENFDFTSPYFFTYIFGWNIFGYLGGVFAWILINVLRIEIRIPKLDLNLQVLSPDRFGGLKFMGDFALKIAVSTSIVATTVPILVEFVLQEDLFILFKLITYLAVAVFPLLVIVSFVLPMIALNKTAGEKKEEMLIEAAIQYQEKLNHFYFDPDKGKAFGVLVYQEMFRDIERMKVWPWSTSVIIKLILSSLVPVATALLRFIPGLS